MGKCFCHLFSQCDKFFPLIAFLRLFGTFRSHIKNFFKLEDINSHDISSQKSMEEIDH